jgi:hypothetical protein
MFGAFNSIERFSEGYLLVASPFLLTSRLRDEIATYTTHGIAAIERDVRKKFRQLNFDPHYRGNLLARSAGEKAITALVLAISIVHVTKRQTKILSIDAHRFIHPSRIQSLRDLCEASAVQLLTLQGASQMAPL